MSWVTFAFISAIFLACSSILEKRVLFREHAMEFSTVLALSNLVFAAPLLLLTDFSVLNFEVTAIIAVACFIGAIAFLFATKGIRHMELSSSTPLFLLSPASAALFAFLFLGENLSQFQISGLFLLVVGAYIVELKHEDGWKGPLKEIYYSKYIHFIIFALFLYGLTALADRLLLAHYHIPVLTYLSIAHVFTAIYFLIFIFLFHDGLHGIKNGFKTVGPVILLISFFLVASRIAQAQAVALAYVGLALAVKRTSSFFTTLIGGELFHEDNLLRKSIACLIMIGGVLLLTK